MCRTSVLGLSITPTTQTEAARQPVNPIWVTSSFKTQNLPEPPSGRSLVLNVCLAGAPGPSYPQISGNMAIKLASEVELGRWDYLKELQC